MWRTVGPAVADLFPDEMIRATGAAPGDRAAAYEAHEPELLAPRSGIGSPRTAPNPGGPGRGRG